MLAHSNTPADTSVRHASPRVPSSFSVDSARRRFFHAFNSLIRDGTDHDNDGGVASAGMPIARWCERQVRLAFTDAM